MLKRGRVVTLGAFLALALLAVIWVSAMPPGTSMPTPSPDDFPMTVNAYWAGVTATAQANATLYGLTSPAPTSRSTWTSFPTDDPFNLTATAFVAGFTATAQAATMVAPAQFPTQDTSVLPFPTFDPNLAQVNQNIDPIYMTATYIVARATQTEAYFMTATANPIEPIYVTASAVVAQATQLQAAYMTATAGGTFTLPTTFPTAVPTLSDEESNSLLEEWTTTLEKAVGFSHPVFGYIAYDLLSFASSDPAYIRDIFKLRPRVERVTYGKREYVAIFVNHISALFGGRLLLFDVSEDTPTLLYHQAYGVPYNGDEDQADSYSFSDINDNNQPDLVVGFNSGGSCPTIGLTILEIQPDGTVTNIMPKFSDGANIEEMVDVNNDGIPEIKTFQRSYDIPLPIGGVCHDIGMTHYYGWDGTAYVDISPDLDESFWPEIESFQDSLKSHDSCLMPDFGLFQVLLAYQVAGRLSEGWAQLQSELHWELCSPEMLIKYGEDMGKFLIWVGTHLQQDQQNIATP